MGNKKEQKEGISRRQFIKVAGMAVLAEELAGGFLNRTFAETRQAAIPGSATSRAIVCDESKCVGCGVCEKVCSKFHHQEANRDLSSIIVEKAPDGAEKKVDVRTCHHCPDPACMKVCPRKAISRDQKTGAVVIDEKLCAGCELCVKACPYGMARFSPAKKKAFKCDLCGGQTRCVAGCPRKALSLEQLTWKDGKIVGHILFTRALLQPGDQSVFPPG